MTFWQSLPMLYVVFWFVIIQGGFIETTKPMSRWKNRLFWDSLYLWIACVLYIAVKFWESL